MKIYFLFLLVVVIYFILLHLGKCEICNRLTFKKKWMFNNKENILNETPHFYCKKHY